jgi:hypothetical protein
VGVVLRFLFPLNCHNCPENLIQYFLNIASDLIIPETQNPKSFRFKVSSSLNVIFFLINMLPAIHFDDQLQAWGTEVDYISPDSMLSAKMNVAKPVRPQENPKAGFLLGLVVAH